MDRMVEQQSASGNTEIVYGPTGKLALMNGQTLRKAFAPLPGGGTAVYIPGSQPAYYRHADWLGSSRLATTPSSPPSNHLYFDGAYAPFGEDYNKTGTTDLSFAQMNQDTVSGLYDAVFREYHPVQGRWISPDLAGLAAVRLANPQTWNRYAYVGNNPLIAVDPLGLAGECAGGGRVCPLMLHRESIAGSWGETSLEAEEIDYLNNAVPGVNVVDGHLMLLVYRNFYWDGDEGIGSYVDDLIWMDIGTLTEVDTLVAANNGGGCQNVNGATVCPTTIDKYNPMERGKTNLRDFNLFCSTHVTIDQTTGQTASHVDLVNPQPLPVGPVSPAVWPVLHVIYDGFPDLVYRTTGHYLVPPGRSMCQ
jgi:RHS repeat-associated protein